MPDRLLVQVWGGGPYRGVWVHAPGRLLVQVRGGGPYRGGLGACARQAAGTGEGRGAIPGGSGCMR